MTSEIPPFNSEAITGRLEVYSPHIIYVCTKNGLYKFERARWQEIKFIKD
ncbi:hypothetical protein LCGC14_1264380 [marine sediment metagenome]|uniref:Uncharacterized protein n=1 Tax=marine sediment metagenome TaxID=412755 RepID=A0A0F9KZX6_9ZZZZ